MARSSWSHTLAFSAAVLALHTVAACNAVLGIEPAELDDTVGMALCPRQSHQAVPKTDCTPCSEDAQGQCNVAACLADHDCRESLRSYRNCVGHACEDQGNACRGCATNKAARELVDCLTARGCSAAAPTSVCEEYCSCMIDECADTTPDGSMGFDGCLTACQQGASPSWQAGLDDPALAQLWTGAQPSWRPYCLWEHCELAADGMHSHCGHAVGRLQWCVSEPKEDTTSPSCAAGKKYGNYPCNKSDECCSKECRTTLSCTAP
jgi:hypothetical protein